MRVSAFHNFCALTILVGVVICVPAWGQRQGVPPFPPSQGRINGHVRLPDGRSAGSGFLVLLEIRSGGTYGQVQTDSTGKFEFTNLSPDLYIVRIRQVGYRDTLEEVDLRTVSSAYVSLEVQPLNKENESVPVGGVVSVQQMAIPDNARKEYESGKELLINHKDYDKSINYFKKAVAAYPNYAEAYLGMGLAYTETKQWKEARAALEKAVAANDKDAGAYIALGGLANIQGKYPEAEQPLLRGLQLAPESPEAHFELARTYWAMGRWQDAEPHAAKAVQLQPNNAGAHILMGNILLRKRNGEGALHEFKESLRLDPKGPLAPATEKMVLKIEAAMKDAKHNQH
ncbi:MAG TPA: tetratricopeptide repeat protein [Terriglobia bacterium]|nr:tetratricopeptide repeat protein [Terriglobia bacterium]